MRFLLDNERAWVGASQFYVALDKLGISPTLYALPIPYIFSADELQYYLDSLENELRGKPRNDYYSYVKERCVKLSEWASRGVIVHVVS
ncbi:hypothetical protein GSbR_41740 [Geobacter sp. SVR]|nr:hypothetical protein GSVR_23990 [Geobacter sp. SVR]GCF87574.1 hypothetical protein GSbR_41740 [Geobacter sp. SVR]